MPKDRLQHPAIEQRLGGSSEGRGEILIETGHDLGTLMPMDLCRGRVVPGLQGDEEIAGRQRQTVLVVLHRSEVGEGPVSIGIDGLKTSNEPKRRVRNAADRR